MKPKSNKGGRGKSPAMITLLIILCGVVLVFFLTVLRQGLTPPESAHVDANSGNPAIESQVMQIAARFACICGSCAGEPLDKCTCDTAVKTRGMIRAGLLAGRPAADIIEEVGRAVGGVRE